MSIKVSVQSITLEAEDEASMQAACSLLGSLLAAALGGSPVAAMTNGEQRETPKIERQPGKPHQKRMAKAAETSSEVDGFRLPDPPPAKPKWATDQSGNRGQREAAGKGGLGDRIVELLDKTGGVAAADFIAGKLGVGTLNVAQSVGKCDRLKKMPGGRVALAAYEDDD